MISQTTIFDLFGGIRPMARKLGEPSSNVAAWKRVGRIPAEKQPHVLETGLALGLPLTAETVIYPLGRLTSHPANIPARPIAFQGVNRCELHRYGNRDASLDCGGAA